MVAVNKSAPLPAEPSLTIGEFCRAEKISVNSYFKMRRAGLGPRELRVNTIVRITHAARLAWQRARENPRGAEAAAVRRQTEAMLEKSEAAAQKAIVSPQHVNKTGRRKRA